MCAPGDTVRYMTPRPGKKAPARPMEINEIRSGFCQRSAAVGEVSRTTDGERCHSIAWAGSTPLIEQ